MVSNLLELAGLVVLVVATFILFGLGVGLAAAGAVLVFLGLAVDAARSGPASE